MDLAGDMAFGHNYGNLRDGRSDSIWELVNVFQLICVIRARQRIP